MKQIRAPPQEERQRMRYAVIILTDSTEAIAVLTVPLGLYLVFSREMLITNNFYWQTKERRGKYGA